MRTRDDIVGRVEEAMQLIAGRWKPAIMFALITQGTKRFSELHRLIPGTSQRMLAKQLRDLELHGFVTRTFFEAVPPRVDYAATALGRSLHPIYKAVCDWAGEHWGEVERARSSRDPVKRKGR
jgi:DNA-binding HxlR family transcriptional regulator